MAHNTLYGNNERRYTEPVSVSNAAAPVQLVNNSVGSMLAALADELDS